MQYPKIYCNSRQQNAKSSGKQECIKNRDWQQKKRHMKGYSCDQHYDKHSNQRKTQIDQPRQNIGKRKQVLRDIDFFESDALEIIEFNAVVVDSELNEKISETVSNKWGSSEYSA